MLDSTPILFPYAHSSFSQYMATNNPFLLSAILGSKNAVAVIVSFPADRYLDIEFESNVEWKARSQYFVRLYVADKVVARSTNSEPQSSVLKLEWNADNQM